MTKDGIEYNLDITPYTLELRYDNLIVNYKFSSELYKQKFIFNLKLNEYHKKLKKQGIAITLDLLTNLSSYIDIEKRGFQITLENEITKLCKTYKNIKDVNLKVTYMFK